mgnify:CR=1 FL=1
MSQKRQEIIENAVKTLKNGGTILYPTETIWGIGCDATNEKAIRKIYKIKKRQKNKPLILLVNSIKLLENYIQPVPDIAYQLIEKEKQPTTIIYNDPKKLPNILIHQNTIGIRVVKNHDIQILLQKFNKAITSTSANISNQNNPVNFSEIDSHIKNNVDYIVPENFTQSKNTNRSSTIIKINNDSSIKIIRK